MNNWLSVVIIVISFHVYYLVAHSETKVYKYVDENGKVVYTSNPPNNSNNIEVIEVNEANTIPPLQIKAKQNEIKQQHDSVTNRIKERMSDREERTAEIKEARLEVTKKKEALEKGKTPQAGERLGTIGALTGNKTRLSQKYHDRVSLLEKELETAEDKLKEVLKKKK